MEEILSDFSVNRSQLIEYLQVKKELFEKDWIDDWFPSEEIENSSKPKKGNGKRRKRSTEDEVNDEDDTIIGPPPSGRLDKTIRGNWTKYQGGSQFTGI